uniref:Uncharacterized protein MANES_11G110400 n=1 Tax=Rhizophora mucronata TaxID=61149 RepID=A0A2P2J459_RHIMU
MIGSSILIILSVGIRPI